MSKVKGGKGKKAKKGKKKGDATEVSLEDRYKKTLQDIVSLRAQLDLKTELAGRSKASASEMKVELVGVKDAIHEEKQIKLDITADMSRQYKSMQNQLEMRIQVLEEEVKRLTSLSDETKLKLHLVTEERDKLKLEKEEQYQALMQKIQSVEQAYESILQDALDSMAVKLEGCRAKWMKESLDIQERNFQLLQEFGSNLKT